MKSSEKDMAVMLDELGLPAAALRWKELSGSVKIASRAPIARSKAPHKTEVSPTS